MKSPELPDSKIFPPLVKRTVLFFLAMCLITLFLYITGTVQGFMDDTQLFLLRLGLGLGILLALSSLYGFILDLVLLFRKKKIGFIFGAFLYAFLGILGALTAASAGCIISAAGGNM
jgi:hypothetical protein